MTVNVTLAEAKMCTFTLESTHFIFNKCLIYAHDGASAKFRTNLQETDYSVVFRKSGKTSQMFTGFPNCLERLKLLDLFHKQTLNTETYSR